MQWSEIDVRIRAQTGHRLGNSGNKVLDGLLDQGIGTAACSVGKVRNRECYQLTWM